MIGVILDCRFYASAMSSAISNNKKSFYKKFVKDLGLTSDELTWLQNTPPMKISLGYRELSESDGLGEFGKFMDQRLKNLPIDDGEHSLIIVDLSSNSLTSIRDPFLMRLCSKFLSYYNNRNLSNFVIILPNALSQRAPILNFLKNAVNGVTHGESNFTFQLVYMQQSIAVDLVSEEIKTGIDSCAEYLQITQKSNIEIIKERCIRRLGHFKDEYAANKRCRLYSFHFNDCEHEFNRYIEAWIKKQSVEITNILLFSQNNIDLRDAVSAYAYENELSVVQINNIDQSDYKEFFESFEKDQQVLIITDVVQTGNSSLRLIKNLDLHGYQVHKTILSAIKKSGSGIMPIGEEGYIVDGLVTQEVEIFDEGECEQCSIGLPFSNGAVEQGNFGIRTYDMIHMSKKYLESEPVKQRPRDGSSMKGIPNFSKWLDEYGDWLAYKIYMNFKANHLGDRIVLVHPDEDDTLALFEEIKKQFIGEVVGIVLPRKELIKEYEKENDWQLVIQKYERDSNTSIAESIREYKRNDLSFVFLDVFNASGTTYAIMNSFAKHFGITMLGYLSLVDFNPAASNGNVIQEYNYSLYEWCDPRSGG